MDAINFLMDGLIKKGRKPRGIYKNLIVGMEMVRCEEYVGSPNNEWKSIRELTSKESGLRQFVCKNGMIKNPNIERYWKDYFELDHIEYYQSDFQYRLIECAMKDETELESFLLDIIKI